MKIKLPLRVEETGIGTTSFYHVIAFDGMFIGMFPDQQTAQLFADCFEFAYSFRQHDESDGTMQGHINRTIRIMEISKRVAEAVEG